MNMKVFQRSRAETQYSSPSPAQCTLSGNWGYEGLSSKVAQDPVLISQWHFKNMEVKHQKLHILVLYRDRVTGTGFPFHCWKSTPEAIKFWLLFSAINFGNDDVSRNFSIGAGLGSSWHFATYQCPLRKQLVLVNDLEMWIKPFLIIMPIT